MYNEAKIDRIDRELVKRNIKFVDKSKLHRKPVVRELFNANTQNQNRLHENFPDENVYVRAQNLADV